MRAHVYLDKKKCMEKDFISENHLIEAFGFMGVITCFLMCLIST